MFTSWDFYVPLASLASFISPKRARSTAVPVSACSCTSTTAVHSVHAGVLFFVFAQSKQDCKPSKRVVKGFGLYVLGAFINPLRSRSCQAARRQLKLQCPPHRKLNVPGQRTRRGYVLLRPSLTSPECPTILQSLRSSVAWGNRLELPCVALQIPNPANRLDINLPHPSPIPELLSI